MVRDPPVDDPYRRALGATREVAQLARMLDALDRELARQRMNAELMRALVRVERNAETVEVLEASLHEAAATIEELSRQREVVARRRDDLAPIAGELAEVRAKRIAKLARSPTGDEVLVLVTRLAELDDEQRAVTQAIAAGEAVEEPLFAITTVGATATGQHFKQAPGSHDYAQELAWLVNNLRKHVTRATARLAVFRRALAEVGVALTAELPSSDHRRLYLTSSGARDDYDALWGEVMAVVQQVAERLTGLRNRKAEIDASITALEAERDRLLES